MDPTTGFSSLGSSWVSLFLTHVIRINSLYLAVGSIIAFFKHASTPAENATIMKGFHDDNLLAMLELYIRFQI